MRWREEYRVDLGILPHPLRVLIGPFGLDQRGQRPPGPALLRFCRAFRGELAGSFIERLLQ